MRTTGFCLISISLVLFLVDRGTQLLSNVLGQLFCGENHLQPVNGVLGDGSCGFNADMYLATALVLAALAGALLAGFSYRNAGKH